MTMRRMELVPWSEEDLPLLQQLSGDPEMTKHIGGPESPEKTLRRHARYVHIAKTGSDAARQLPLADGHGLRPGAAWVFKIAMEHEGEGVGSIAFWERTWRDRLVYEMGWSVLPAFQGQSIATNAAAVVVAKARLERNHRFMHAFPSPANAPSNAICRKVGFPLIEECEFEYPPGSVMRVNDWCLDLFAPAGCSDTSAARPSALTK